VHATSEILLDNYYNRARDMFGNTENFEKPVNPEPLHHDHNVNLVKMPGKVKTGVKKTRIKVRVSYRPETVPNQPAVLSRQPRSAGYWRFIGDHPPIN